MSHTDMRGVACSSHASYYITASAAAAAALLSVTELYGCRYRYVKMQLQTCVHALGHQAADLLCPARLVHCTYDLADHLMHAACHMLTGK